MDRMQSQPTSGNSVSSKLTLSGARTRVQASEVQSVLEGIFVGKGCSASVAREIAEHLIDADLSGVESHGVMRTLQYAAQYESGYLKSDVGPRVAVTATGVAEIDGCGGIGIPAMRLAIDKCSDLAKERGNAIVPIRNVGHTGRLGAFAENGANKGCLVVIIGGGGRQKWRQVAPFGGRKALLPTNPFCFAMPGGEQGPVVVDFATSVIAGGWLYAARAAGAIVPEEAIIDRNGLSSRDPSAYFDGGAILPKGGAMGYGLAVIAELIGEAMLGPVTTEVNWLVMAVDVSRYQEPHVMRVVAEEILEELRNCPPAQGFEKVEVPGERERNRRAFNPERILTIPEKTWAEIKRVAMYPQVEATGG
jgi:LDH2 family malate/lactate/ureidoglycolate dehydrogenase